MAIEAEDIAPPGPLLRERYQGSASGRRWLERAPRLAAHYGEEWGLQLGRPLRTSSSFLLPARDRSGEDMILKVASTVSEANLEVLCFSAWPDVSPHVFRRDLSRGVFLMERVRPGALPGQKSRLPAAGRMLRLTSRIKPEGRDVLRLPRLVDRMRETRFPLDSDLWPGVEVRHEAVKRMRVGPRRLLHGRFSPLGVVESREGWVLISPRPVLGDPCYDAACWALSDEASGSIRHNCRELARHSGLPEERVREMAWIVAALDLSSASSPYAARLRRFIRAVSDDPLVKAFSPPEL